MADVNGWPDVKDVATKLDVLAPDGITEAVQLDLSNLLASVIAEFQAPVGRRGGGGTGRQFTPVVQTRTYDGNGYPELRVDDIVPSAPLTVTAYGAALPDVQLKTDYHGLGSNVLIRPQSSGAILGTSYGLAGIFPLGKQNITVTTTFGYAATVPVDVWEAVRCEVAYRALIQGAVDLEGLGDKLKIGQFEIDTNPSAIYFGETSPLPVLHATYEAALSRYRDRGNWRIQRLAPRMS